MYPNNAELEDEVLRYQRLRAQLKRCLGFAGACISVMLLSVGAFHNLLNQAVPSQPDVFSATGAMGFGVYFTGFLALVYLPAAKTLSEAGDVPAADPREVTLKGVSHPVHVASVDWN